MKMTNNQQVEEENSILNRWTVYFIELRVIIFKSLAILLLVFAILYSYSAKIYNLLALPLIKHLKINLIATHLTSTFIAPLKLCLVLSLVISMPLILQQLWSFIAPGLYRQEKFKSRLLLLLSIILFYLGLCFCYFIVLPIITAFLIHIAPPGINVTPDISAYLDFSLSLFLAFGLSFEIPILIIILVLANLVSISSFEQKRPYMIVLSFIIAMFLTPPDVFSQILLAIPMWILFEIGLLIAKILQKKSC